MTGASPKLRDLAERLVAYEKRGNKSNGKKILPGFRVCEKLRLILATLMGNTGFHALLERALVLVNADDPALCAVHLKADGTLGGVHESEMQVSAETMAEASVVLVAQLLSLLVAFIGEHLTLRLLGEVWPKISVSALYFGKKD